ncbi:MAG TPA: carboxypeptidase-like regulatory domain-containing protein [Pyrinomonadaceae bacterium]|jgi:hypothetical protein|nr:carboxypeptidase-like regulatory domain-containing protein [Pyrinomonadaceae bacterium]
MNKALWRMSVLLLVSLVLSEAGAGARVAASAGAGGRKSFGTVTGTVRDSRGNPLAGALVSLLRDGADEVVRQTKSAADGTFLARVAPGRYLLRAVADGFNTATFNSVQVGASDELVYRFNLEPAGQGRTTPERRPDRNDAKFRMRSSQPRRSVFQIDEAEDAVASATEAAIAEEASDAGLNTDEISLRRGAEDDETRTQGRTQGVVETFFVTSAGADDFGGTGLNFAVASPVNENLELVFAGQMGALDRLEATARVRAGTRHRLNFTLGGARVSLFPKAAHALGRDTLGQFSLRTIDEWVVRDGVVLVVGLDYSRFVGARGKGSLTPRFGVQFDANARTRLRAAYAPGGRESRVQSTSMFEDVPVVFHEQANEPVAVVDGNAVMERSRRLEFGIERVLDDSSSIEATAFLDTTDGRGVGVLSTPLNAFTDENGASLLSVANQQGGARGLRIVYTRRISNSLRASAGYAFGRGQQLAPATISVEAIQLNPEQVFQNGFFQTAAAQVDADLADGTRVRTVLRFSPRAAVFAIDPFAGRLAVYDPSLSIQVTQELPNFGLPLRAEAVLDARNLLDTLICTEDGENLFSVANTRRTLRGGISVRF